MESDNYDVLPLPVNLFGEYEKLDEGVKPFVGVYFPAELLARMNWTRKTPLSISVDGECLIICKKDLEYEIEESDEPTYI
jgi:hypothetical protein